MPQIESHGFRDAEESEGGGEGGEISRKKYILYVKFPY